MNKIVLYPKQLRSRFLLSDVLSAASHNVELTQQYIIDQMMTEFTATLRCVGTQQVRKEDYNIPVSWWNHLKQEVFPKRLLKCFPVKYKTLKVIREYWNICPHLLLPNVGQDVHIAWLDRPPILMKDIDDNWKGNE